MRWGHAKDRQNTRFHKQTDSGPHVGCTSLGCTRNTYSNGYRSFQKLGGAIPVFSEAALAATVLFIFGPLTSRSFHESTF